MAQNEEEHKEHHDTNAVRHTRRNSSDSDTIDIFSADFDPFSGFPASPRIGVMDEHSPEAPGLEYCQTPPGSNFESALSSTISLLSRDVRVLDEDPVSWTKSGLSAISTNLEPNIPNPSFDMLSTYEERACRDQERRESCDKQQATNQINQERQHAAKQYHEQDEKPYQAKIAKVIGRSKAPSGAAFRIFEDQVFGISRPLDTDTPILAQNDTVYAKKVDRNDETSQVIPRKRRGSENVTRKSKRRHLITNPSSILACENPDGSNVAAENQSENTATQSLKKITLDTPWGWTFDEEVRLQSMRNAGSSWNEIALVKLTQKLYTYTTYVVLLGISKPA